MVLNSFTLITAEDRYNTYYSTEIIYVNHHIDLSSRVLAPLAAPRVNIFSVLVFTSDLSLVARQRGHILALYNLFYLHMTEVPLSPSSTPLSLTLTYV